MQENPSVSQRLTAPLKGSLFTINVGANSVRPPDRYQIKERQIRITAVF